MPTANRPRGGNLTILGRQQAGGFKVAATGDYQPLPVYSFGVGKQKPLQDDPLLGQTKHNSLDATAPAPGLATVSGPVVAPLDFSHAGPWLYSAFGAPAITGSNPNYVHTFTSGLAVLPERTIERAMAKASGSILLQTVGLMVDRLSVVARREAGYARLNLDCVAYDEADLGSSSGAGTPQDMWARDPIAAALGIYKIDSVAAGLLECNLQFSNNLQPREEIGDDRMGGYEPGEKSLTGSIRLRLRDLTLVNAAEAGTPHAGELLFQRNGNRSLSFACPAVRLERPVINNEGPDGIDVTFNLRGEQTAAAPMLTVVLKSAIADFAGI
jgi:hypothetical protein